MTNANDQHTSSLISDLIAMATKVIQQHRPTPAQWQSAKQRPTQFGDNKNRPNVKQWAHEPKPSPEDDMERDRR